MRSLPSVIAGFLVILLPPAARLRAAQPAQIVMPGTLFAVVGSETTLHLNNLLRTQRAGTLSVTTQVAGATETPGLWRWNPSSAQTGDHQITFKLQGEDGRVLESRTATVHVVPNNAGKSRTISLLLVGDSLTAGSYYPEEVARLLGTPGNPKFQLLGTQTRPYVPPTVVHEGYGGWSWQTFNSRYFPGKPVDDKTRSSPFVFASGQPPAPKLDVQRYISEHCGGRPPDFVTFLLGINDCFGLNTDTPESIDSGVRKMLKEADTLLAAFRKAAPVADLGVCLTPPPNDRDEAFVANYKTKYTRANWLKVQRRLVELQIQHFSHRENDRIHVVPTGFNLDTWNGYPENNAVHPNPAGYQQIGSSIYAWLKWRLEAADAGTAGRQP